MVEPLPRRRRTTSMPDTRRRLTAVRVLLVLLLVVVLGRLWMLQVVSGPNAAGTVAATSLRSVPVAPERGRILDASGRTLAGSTHRLEVTADRVALGRLAATRRADLFARLGWLLGLSADAVRLRTVSCQADEARALRLHGPDCFDGRSVDPAVVARDAGAQAGLAIAEDSESFPAVTVVDRGVRAYPRPEGASLAAALGYLALPNADDLAAAAARGRRLDPLRPIGKAGLEQVFEDALAGTPGRSDVRVDRAGNAAGQAGGVPARDGLDLQTHVDVRVQALLERQLDGALAASRGRVERSTGRHYAADSGAALVLDTRSGAVLGMASAPGYDPGQFVDGLGEADAARVFGSSAPTLDRAVSGVFAPGSTFKPITTAGALRAGFGMGDRLACPGQVNIGGRTFTNFHSQGREPLTFTGAIKASCDTFFYQVGVRLWRADGGLAPHAEARESVAAAAHAYGFGSRTGIDLPGEAVGTVPDRAWRMQRWEQGRAAACRLARTGADAVQRRSPRDTCRGGGQERAGDAALTAIGQGDVLVSPVQLAVAYAAIFNGGIRWTPQLGADLLDPDGQVVTRIPPEVAGRITGHDPEVGNLRRALQLTAIGGSPSKVFRGLAKPLGLGAKTGTAEVAGHQPTSWLVSANADYTVVVLMSQAGTGSIAAGPPTRAIWTALYGMHGGVADPQLALAPPARVQARTGR